VAVAVSFETLENKHMENIVRISKFLSKHLRHAPEAIGITLEPGGWVAIDTLLEACAKHGMRISRETLNTVVQENSKQRFGFDETGTRIRANQGHSTNVELKFENVTPPETLYHGTATQFLPSILETGIQRMNRHHVHLSSDTETAAKVGLRHGKLAMLEVNAKAMVEAGFVFYRSVNGVWLVDNVPAEYLSQK
jgi:putative RNA 2'-phosphotransferase